ncbi:MAG: tRNA pseudouridine(55) synthase TruB [Muribaculaceae bacterium]|nr:tRNA pseudouridine(55) synthase TruB [Muribaculaceae bacterium]
MDFVSGQILKVDKPLHWTSFDVVKRIRGVLTRRHGVKRFKVGHAGTLDPLATGVMLICTGRATKLIDQLQAGEKEYVATVRLGATTPSFDLETEIDQTFPTDHIDRQAVEAALEQFRGAIMQVPPVFSAVKVNGKRAYKMARKGEAPELKAKPIVISELELLDFDPATCSVRLRIACSKGTYIRSLARDLGAELGCGGHLTALRRTRVGSASIYDCTDVRSLIEELKTIDIEIPTENNSSSK